MHRQAEIPQSAHARERLRDAQEAQAAVREHLSGTLAQIDTIRRSHPDYLTD